MGKKNTPFLKVVILGFGSKKIYIMYPDPPKMSNFRPQVCFWWLRGSNFRPLEDSGILYINIGFSKKDPLEAQSCVFDSSQVRGAMLEPYGMVFFEFCVTEPFKANPMLQLEVGIHKANLSLLQIDYFFQIWFFVWKKAEPENVKCSKSALNESGACERKSWRKFQRNYRVILPVPFHAFCWMPSSQGRIFFGNSPLRSFKKRCLHHSEVPESRDDVVFHSETQIICWKHPLSESETWTSCEGLTIRLTKLTFFSSTHSWAVSWDGKIHEPFFSRCLFINSETSLIVGLI